MSFSFMATESSRINAMRVRETRVVVMEEDDA